MDPNVCKKCLGQLKKSAVWSALEWAWVRCTCAQPARPNTPAAPAVAMVV
jgi:hypothetical protein